MTTLYVSNERLEVFNREVPLSGVALHADDRGVVHRVAAGTVDAVDGWGRPEPSSSGGVVEFTGAARAVRRRALRQRLNQLVIKLLAGALRPKPGVPHEQSYPVRRDGVELKAPRLVNRSASVGFAIRLLARFVGFGGGVRSHVRLVRRAALGFAYSVRSHRRVASFDKMRGQGRDGVQALPRSAYSTTPPRSRIPAIAGSGALCVSAAFRRHAATALGV